MNSAFNSIWQSIKQIPYWLSYSTLQEFSWERGWLLPFILAVPLLFFIRWLFNVRFRQTFQIHFTTEIKTFSFANYLRFLPDIILSCFLACLIIVLARPQKHNKMVENKSEGIDIMLAIDISESMLIEDFKPNRLESAKKVALKFINGRKHDRIGLVVFSGEAFTVCPLTNDYALIKEQINNLHHNMIAASGTVMGNALASALNRLRETYAKSKVIILIGDGANIEGEIDPITAAKLCSAFGVKVYGIGVGKDGDVPYRDEKGEIHFMKNTLDETTLRKISYETNGQYFRADNKESLDHIFAKINKLEKTEIYTETYIDTQDYYSNYLKIAILFFLVWLLLKSTFLSNVLED